MMIHCVREQKIHSGESDLVFIGLDLLKGSGNCETSGDIVRWCALFQRKVRYEKVTKRLKGKIVKSMSFS